MGRLRSVFIVLIGLLLVLTLAAFIGPSVQTISFQSHPVTDYAQAVQAIQAMQTMQGSAYNPVCRTQLMTHGQQVDQAIILVHGYTFCPYMYETLAKQFYDLGYNILIPPLPHHGLANSLTDDQQNLTAEEMAAYTDQAVDIAHGLGKRVTMVGISAGGVVTAWAAQNRGDLALAVPISPGFGFLQVPGPLTVPAINIFLTLPNSFQWWDDGLKEKVGPPNTYPRYSTHALAQILRFGYAVGNAARQKAPAANSILVITNANDDSVDNAATATVVKAWRDHGAQNLRTFEFDKSLKLGHDLIDPARPNQRVDIVYPKLIELVTSQ